MNVIIIGGSSGIGKSLALLFAEKGDNVMITGRRIEKLQETKNIFSNKINFKYHDVNDIVNSEKTLNEMFSTMGIVDILIYSSGIGEPNYDLDFEVENKTLQTNVIAATHIYGYAFRFFRKQGFGHIVGISSIAGLRGNRHVPAYFASKAYQINYLESLWLKGKRSKAKIVVSNIMPGFVDTDMAQGKTFWMASPEKAAKQILYAIKKKKKSVYVTKRWWIIAQILKFLPSKILLKM